MNQLHILLVPLVHTALTRWGTILGLEESALDQLPDDEHSPDFMDDFLMFIDTHEWESFISNQVRGRNLQEIYSYSLCGVPSNTKF